MSYDATKWPAPDYAIKHPDATRRERELEDKVRSLEAQNKLLREALEWVEDTGLVLDRDGHIERALRGQP